MSVMKEQFFCVGEIIALEDHGNSSLEWVVKLSQILSVGLYKNRYYTFIKLMEIIIKQGWKMEMYRVMIGLDNLWLFHTHTLAYAFNQLHWLKRKLMLHDSSPCQSTPSIYLAVNIDIFDKSKSFDLPTYPKVGEIILQSNCGSSKVNKITEEHCEDSSFVAGIFSKN